MSAALRYRVMEWPLPADEMAVALVLAVLADDATRITAPMTLTTLGLAIELPTKRLSVLLDRLEARGAIDRVRSARLSRFIVAAAMPKAVR
jgi:hypothetical protein